MYSEVTAVLKTFLRDYYLMECLKSLREQYPDIRIIVADDGHKRMERSEKILKYANNHVYLDWDSGLPAGRNRALRIVETPYVFIGDDDFYHDSKALDKLLPLMEVADIAGGRVKHNNVIGDYQGFFVERDNGKELKWQRLESEDYKEHKGSRYIPVDLTYNFFLGKTEKVREVGWDENIKISFEHSDFFLAAKKNGLKVVYCPDAIVDHKPMHVEINKDEEAEYRPFRLRRTDRDYFVKKWGYGSYADMNDNLL